MLIFMCGSLQKEYTTNFDGMTTITRENYLSINKRVLYFLDCRPYGRKIFEYKDKLILQYCPIRIKYLFNTMF